jgi:hypothetical protein
MLSELDSLYWVVSCQTSWLNSEKVAIADVDHLYNRWCVAVSDFDNTDTVLWRPGSLSALDGYLRFDEWSYFVGFKAKESEAIRLAARISSQGYFSKRFYDLLKDECQLFAVQVDGWWEFSSAYDELVNRIISCTTCREIVPREAGALDWTPQFL